MVEKKSHHITELYRLISVVLIILGALISLAVFLYSKDRVTQINNFSFLLVILLVFIVFILLYLIFVMITLMLEYNILSIYKSGGHQVELLNNLRKISYNWFYKTVFTAIFTVIVLFIGLLIRINFKIGLALIVIWIIGLIFGVRLGEGLINLYRFENASSIKKVIIIFLTALLAGLFFNTIWSYTLFFSSGFDIVFDKTHYFNNEDVYVQIYPKGIVSPEIIDITYHRTLLNYPSDPEFKKSPIYLKIPSSILKTQSYNSFLIITYKYKSDSWVDELLRDLKLSDSPITKRQEYIPVYESES